MFLKQKFRMYTKNGLGTFSIMFRDYSSLVDLGGHGHPEKASKRPTLEEIFEYRPIAEQKISTRSTIIKRVIR